uniref:Uncharacterized protein n=1 Tax=Rousettus aegyptiacus TaxID=9407 RepID=A0A7J8BA44_ROUAE|nr:hypothetical protein HJG63_009938 [Rousettus aegyptiacus]
MCDSYFSKIFKTKGGDCPRGAVFTQVQVKTARETTLTGCHPPGRKGTAPSSSSGQNAHEKSLYNKNVNMAQTSLRFDKNPTDEVSYCNPSVFKIHVKLSIQELLPRDENGDFSEPVILGLTPGKLLTNRSIWLLSTLSHARR